MRPVAASADDAEEGPKGGVDLTSSDLELVTDGKKVQTVGMRFRGVAIPRGAVPRSMTPQRTTWAGLLTTAS